MAARDDRIVVPRDADFDSSHPASNQPRRLLLITTGNIFSRELKTLLVPSIPAIAAAFATCNFVELTRNALILHA